MRNSICGRDVELELYRHDSNMIVLALPLFCLSLNNTARKSAIYQIQDVNAIVYHEHFART
jgi:hypothetical protein